MNVVVFTYGRAWGEINFDILAVRKDEHGNFTFRSVIAEDEGNMEQR